MYRYRYEPSNWVRQAVLRDEEGRSERHSKGREMVNFVNARSSSSWTVLSSTGDGSYVVSQSDEHVCDVPFEKYCDVQCSKCEACRESHQCECPDYAKGNLCKHIHAVCIFVNGPSDLEHHEDNQADPSSATSSSSIRRTRAALCFCEAQTQTDPLEPVPVENPTPGTSNDQSRVDPLSRRMPGDIKTRLMASAQDLPRKLLAQIDRLGELELLRVRVLLRQMEGIVRDNN